MEYKGAKEGLIRSICISERRGTEKRPVPEAVLVEEYGIQGDAHAGSWHRQVSLLSYDRVEEFCARGGRVSDGDFGENLLVSGMDFRTMPVGSRLLSGEVILEITQIGKECHSHCAIFHRVGECIMPKEGVFARVIHGGVLCPGDRLVYQKPLVNRPLTAAVIVLSDRGSRGEREDQSGPEAVCLLQKAGYQVEEQLLLPDEPEKLKRELRRLSDSRQLDLILTSGGTGFSLRDQTPEATLAVAERQAPGISEAIRWYSLRQTKRAMLSRGVSVIRGKTLIVNLPGSPKAVREGLEAVLETLEHGIRILRGTETDCAQPLKMDTGAAL